MLRRFDRLLVMALLSVVPPGALAAESSRRAFVYEQGQPSAKDGTIRIHEAGFPRMARTVRLYATAAALPANPVPALAGHLQGAQQILVGQKTEGQFVPALRIGVVDSGRGPAKDVALLSLSAGAGNLDHFGDFARPETPCDFRVIIDLQSRTATVWTSRRGDDRWFLLVDAAAVPPEITAIDTLRVEQHLGASGFSDVVLQDRPWAEGELLRPHPLAKKTASAADGRFRFQPMRSTWRTGPGRHVTIARNPPVWFGFPEVVRVGERTLIVAHNDGRQHGGGGGLFVRRSEDLGRTWQGPIALPVTGVNCPRLQVLGDSSLLLLADIHGAVGLTPLFRSEDGGRTWKKIGQLDAEKAGGHAAIVPSRVHEQIDGSWLVVGSWYPGGKPWEGTEGEQLEIFRSADRGATWTFHSALQAFPTHGHSLSEASFLRLKDGRLRKRTWRCLLSARRVAVTHVRAESGASFRLPDGGYARCHLTEWERAIPQENSPNWLGTPRPRGGPTRVVHGVAERSYWTHEGYMACRAGFVREWQ